MNTEYTDLTEHVKLIRLLYFDYIHFKWSFYSVFLRLIRVFSVQILN